MPENYAPDLIDRTLASLAQFATAFDAAHLAFLALAIIPAAAWLFIFLRHNPENRTLAFLTFVAGMLSVIPIFIFQHEIVRIDSWLVTAGLGAITTIALSSLWVGVYEETAKHWVVKLTDQQFFRSIDDAIEFSIIAALGFSFFENILYFHSIWNSGVDNFWFYFVFRSTGSMFLHIFASGIFGYYYGVAHFATEKLKDELAAGKSLVFTETFHKLLHMKSSTVFHEEKILEGLVLASVLHGLFDFMMSLSQYYSDQGSALGAKIWLALAVPFLVVGYFWLTYLLDKKEDHKIYGNLGYERTSGE